MPAKRNRVDGKRRVRKTASRGEADRLVSALRDAKGHEARSRIRGRLLNLGSAAAPPLVAALSDSDDFTRWEAINLLGELAPPNSLLSVVRFALREQEVHARWRSYWAVTRFDRAKTVPHLLRALKRGPSRWPAALILSMMNRHEAGPTIVEGLRARDSWKQYEALSAVRALKLANAVEAVGRFLRADRPIEHRQEAALALGAIGTRAAVTLLVDALSDPESGVRWRASMGLGLSAHEAAANALRKRLAQEPDAAVRKQIQADLQHHAAETR